MSSPASGNDSPARPTDPASGATSAGAGRIDSVPAGLILGAALLVGLAVRFAWAAKYGLSLEQEGVEYTRIAQNLLAGKGYVGIFNNGPQLNFPPFYPILIAAASLVIPAPDLAARAVCIVLGAALVVPAFKIAEMAYGRRSALAVALLITLHPVLIAGSASTYAEGPYLTLLMFGLWFLARWIAGQELRFSILAGVFFGLAYLVRPEAFLFVGAFTGLGILALLFARDRGAVLRGTLALPLAFSVIAAPNVVFLTRATGHFRIEAKGTLAYQWGERINSGLSYAESVKGIGEDLSDQGVFMRPNLEVITSTHYTTAEYLRFVAQAVKRNAGPIRDVIIGESSFGSPLLFVLVVLALLGSGWTRQQLLLAGPLVVTAGLVVAVLGTVQELWFRYFYSLLGIFLIWGGKGALDLGQWARTTVSALNPKPALVRAAGQAATALALLLVLALSARNIRDVSQFHESLWPERAAAGRWLAAQEPSHKWVMDGGLQVAFYAGGDMIYLPYARADLALRYVAKKRPDYIVLHSATRADLPYTADWFDHGIPDSRARLVYDKGDAGRDHIKIYRWVDPSPAP